MTGFVYLRCSVHVLSGKKKRLVNPVGSTWTLRICGQIVSGSLNCYFTYLLYFASSLISSELLHDCMT